MRRCLLLLAVAACGLDDSLGRMSEQLKAKPQGEVAAFADGRVNRAPPPGTVPRERELDLERQVPPIGLSLLEKGRRRYDVACAPCHGLTGEADTLVAAHLKTKPPSLLESKVHEKSDEHVFTVITQGSGAMPAQPDIPPDERWGVAGYLRALQLSQRSKLEDAPPEMQAKLKAQEAKPR
jgi:mono/diheme cytochrome c family protein